MQEKSDQREPQETLGATELICVLIVLVIYVAVHIFKIQSIIIKFATFFYENGKLTKLIGGERT